MKKIFVTGTDTGVGKTIVSAGLCLTWPAHYWKPIQAGYQYQPKNKAQTPDTNTNNNAAKNKSQSTLSEPLNPKLATHHSNLNKHIFPQTDNEVLSQFIPTTNIHPSRWTLKNPLSPNQSAEMENIQIQSTHIKIPDCPSNLIIEGAGGALVPFNDKEDMSDLMKKWDCPVIITARSGLGTLNHTFLTVKALKAKKIQILGVIMIGPFHPMNKKDIEKKAPVLLELPFLKKLSPETLTPYFEQINLIV